MKVKSISKKVLVGNLTITFVSFLAVFSVICYFVCSYQIKKIETEEQRALDLYVWELDRELSDALKKGRSILSWSTVKEICTNDNEAIDKQYDIYRNIKFFMDNVTADNTLGFIIYTENPYAFRSQYIEKSALFEEYMNIKKTLLSTNTYMSRDVYQNESGREYIRFFLDIKHKPGGVLECDVYLPEETGGHRINVVSTHKPYMNGELRENLNEVFSVSLSIDENERKAVVLNTILFMLVIALIFIGTVLLITYRNTRNIMNRVTDFISGLNENETYMTDGYLSIDDDDAEEVRTIKSTISILLRRMKEITESHNRIENEKRELDIHLLRKQLDPHTLYNSLSAIKLNAFMKNDEYTINLVDTMIDYYRATLNKGNTFISLKDEIYMIEKFLKINEMAHGQSFGFCYEISDELINFRVPSMMLHVFVENSVVHGLCGNKKDCKISIVCKEQNESVIITIEDNGYGISKDKLKELNNMTEEYHGYGIKNSYQRMKMTYGDDINIRFESSINEWTRVTLTIPRKYFI